MSAIDTKRTCAPHRSMSAYRGKADMSSHRRMSASDPKRTSTRLKSRSAVGLPQWYLPVGSTGDTAIETARVHHAARQCGDRVAGRGAHAAGGDAGYWVPQ